MLTPGSVPIAAHMSAKALIDVTLATRGALRLAGAGVAARSIRSVKPMEGSDLVTHPVPPTMINQSHPVRTDQHHEPLVPRQYVIQPARRAADRQLPDQLPTSLNLAAERHELEAEFKPSREQSAKLEEPRRQQPLPTEYVTVQTSPPSTQEDMHSHGQKLAFTERPKPVSGSTLIALMRSSRQLQAKLLKASKVPSSRLGRMVHYGGKHTILVVKHDLAESSSPQVWQRDWASAPLQKLFDGCHLVQVAMVALRHPCS